jgi:hypothetical protein
MSLYDGAADGESDSHTVGFGRIERFEDLVCSLRRETDSRVFHAEPDLVPFSPFSSNQQLSRAIVDCAHRVSSISKHIQDDLLKLDAVTDDKREVIRKLMPQNHAASLDLSQRQCRHLSNRFIQVHRFGRRLFLAVKRPQSRDYVRGPVAIANRAPGRFPRALDVWGIGGKHPQAGAGIGDDSRERLVDFVRDRSG